MAKLTKDDTIRALAAGGTVAVDRIEQLESALPELVEARDARDEASMPDGRFTPEAHKARLDKAELRYVSAWIKARKELGEGGGK